MKKIGVPGMYLHDSLPVDKKLLMNFEGEFLDSTCEVKHEYRPNMIIENGKKVLYVQSLEAIYGMIKNTLHWYELYTTTLKDLGFKINSYNMCVAKNIKLLVNIQLDGFWMIIIFPM